MKTITHTSFSLKPFFLFITAKTVRFNCSQSSQEGITRNTSLDKIFRSLEFQTSLRVEGISEIHAKRFPYIDFPRFLLSIDKNHLIANDFYRYRLLSIDFSGITTPGTTTTSF